jgi:hypothetical protein
MEEAGMVARLVLAAAMIVAAAPAVAASDTERAVANVVVTVRCSSNPEKVTIRNNRNGPITINTVGSTYHPYSDEPFHVNKTLPKGGQITYSFGTRPGPNKLTNRYIFDNEAASESARVRNNLGTIRRYC